MEEVKGKLPFTLSRATTVYQGCESRRSRLWSASARQMGSLRFYILHTGLVFSLSYSIYSHCTRMLLKQFGEPLTFNL